MVVQQQKPRHRLGGNATTSSSVRTRTTTTAQSSLLQHPRTTVPSSLYPSSSLMSVPSKRMVVMAVVLFLFLSMLFLQVTWWKSAIQTHYYYDTITPSRTNDFSGPTRTTLLRLNYSHLDVHGELTQRMVRHQNDCSLPLGTFAYRNRFGLGSDLHVWGQALCNGMMNRNDGSGNQPLRLRTVGNWTWMDQEACRSSGTSASPMECYFHQSELTCPQDEMFALEHPVFDVQQNLSRPNGNVNRQAGLCHPTINDHQTVPSEVYVDYDDFHRIRLAGIEYLFTRVSPLVMQEAERQLERVFASYHDDRDKGERTSTNVKMVPDDLITVHIRWGDKRREMKLVGIEEYVSAVQQILLERRRRKGPLSTRHASVEHHDPDTTAVEIAHIYLATEDPAAVEAFRNATPPSWHIYVDDFYTQLLPHRIDEYNGAPKMSKALNGRAGLIALGSLLVAMEANDFVLTTESNWSRLMDEIRKTIIDPRCNGCTSMIDLRAVRKEW